MESSPFSFFDWAVSCLLKDLLKTAQSKKERGFHAAEGEIPLMAVIREYLIDGHILVR
jgi:hypothetical protein